MHKRNGTSQSQAVATQQFLLLHFYGSPCHIIRAKVMTQGL